MHLLALLLLFGASYALLVPSPPGPYHVSVKHIELVDLDRLDPFAPEANIQRRIMASAYLPIDSRYDCEVQVVPYIPHLTASTFEKASESLGLPQGVLGDFEMEFCDIETVNLDEGHKKRKRKSFPVAVFSPGFQGTRFVYGALARSLASLGHIVVTLDHTYETPVVEFPDGTAAYANLVNGTATLQQLETRTADESFLISQLSNTTVTESLFANFPGAFNPRKIVVYGHSFGGATAAATAQHDPNVIGGLNFDGWIYGPVNQEGFKDKPFILVGQNYSEPLPEWDEFYNKVDAAKMELAVRDTQHNAFMDFPLLLTTYQVPPEFQHAVDEVFGKLNGRKVEKVINEVMVALMELLFKNNPKPLRNVDMNPDIDILRSDMPVGK